MTALESVLTKESSATSVMLYLYCASPWKRWGMVSYPAFFARDRCFRKLLQHGSMKLNTDVVQDDVVPNVPLEEHEGQDESVEPPAVDDVRLKTRPESMGTLIPAYHRGMKIRAFDVVDTFAVVSLVGPHRIKRFVCVITILGKVGRVDITTDHLLSGHCLDFVFEKWELVLPQGRQLACRRGLATALLDTASAREPPD